MIAVIILIIILVQQIKFQKKEKILILQQHTAKIDMIRKDHSDTLEKIRVEMLNREETRNKQWIDSEKEVLLVLNGVSNLIDLSEKINRVEIDKIIETLKKINNDIQEIKKATRN